MSLADPVVSHETRAKLDIYVDELRRWQKVVNLVGPKTLDDIWHRHIDDSLQLAPLADGRVWVDLGSGAGLPGLVLSAIRPDATFHLVESDSRKCAFLGTAARAMGTQVQVWNERIETALPKIFPVPDVVTARAVAPLVDLVGYAESLLRQGATGLFPKGRQHAAELTQARESWRFEADLVPSRTDAAGRIIRITGFDGRQSSPGRG